LFFTAAFLIALVPTLLRAIWVAAIEVPPRAMKTAIRP
jgi:hypothetical protein